MLSTIRKIFSLLSRRELIQLGWLMIIIILMALVEVLGIASVMPFVALLSNPGIVHSNQMLHWAFAELGFSEVNQFLLFLGILVFVSLLLNTVFVAFTMWRLTMFTYMHQHALSRRLLAQYLYRPYVFFLNRNSSDLTKNMLTEAGRYVVGVLMPGMNIVARSVGAVLIVVVLLVADPLIAATALGVLCGSYAVTYLLVGRMLGRIGKDRLAASTSCFKVISEALGGIKEIKLLGMEEAYIERYSHASIRSARRETTYHIITMVPRYALELVVIGGLLAVILYVLSLGRALDKMIPLIALYAFASYRLMPALQQIYSSATAIKFNLSTLDVLCQDLLPDKHEYETALTPFEQGRLPFSRQLVLQDVTFSYPGAAVPVVQGMSLSIAAYSTIGFVGATGAGKSTVVDIISGLLAPQEGALLVDGAKVSVDNLRRWQNNIGYVPQDIFLSDDTVARNIAIGVADEKIDMGAVACAASVANVHDFITQKLPDGYRTDVGERGVRLSGGQRQRIGIARALYHNPSVLIFDEATSSLDGITESVVMDAISRLAHTMTIIIIAHRLATVRGCDSIFMLDQGKVVARGAYSELMEGSRKFREMADAGNIPSADSCDL